MEVPLKFYPCCSQMLEQTSRGRTLQPPLPTPGKLSFDCFTLGHLKVALAAGRLYRLSVNLRTLGVPPRSVEAMCTAPMLFIAGAVRFVSNGA
ncbi:hypothetical protein MTO96_013322 [Rhipicephalus appendiculatus]